MKFKSFFPLVVAIWVAGCGWIPLKHSESSQVDRLLAYHRHLTLASPDVQKREFADALTAYERQQDDQSRLQLALTLMLPGTAWRDDARALQLVGVVVGSGAAGENSPTRDFALLLDRTIVARRDEQRRCELRIEAQRDERRKTEQKLDSAKEECHKAEVLQQKLDELRDIDRDMRKRPGRKAKP